jgi:hypothetical protein
LSDLIELGFSSVTAPLEIAFAKKGEKKNPKDDA